MEAYKHSSLSIHLKPMTNEW